MTIGVVTAMDNEREQVSRLLSSKREDTLDGRKYTVGKLGANEIVLTSFGIGKVNAALGAAAIMTAYKLDALVSSGVAGGIDSAVGVMDVVAGTEYVYHDVECGFGNVHGQVQGLPPRFEADGKLLDAVRRIQPLSGTRIHLGLMCTGDQFITDRAQLDAIKSAFPEGLACEMESAALAHACHYKKLPFISFRIISDTPGVKKHIDQYENFWQEMADRSFGVTKLFLESI